MTRNHENGPENRGAKRNKRDELPALPGLIPRMTRNQA
jgi:hypothetical protein